jgi:hypothetical protein
MVMWWIAGAVAVIAIIATAIIYKRRKKEKEMPQGIQVFDENGQIIADMTSRTSKILGTVNTNGRNGSLTDNRLLDGNLWVAIEKMEPTGIADVIGLEVVANGSTLSWTHHRTSSVSFYNFRFVYGIY